MSRKIWTLTDLDHDLYLAELRLGPADVGGDSRFSVRKRTLRGGLRDGVDVVEVDNGTLRFVVVPDRGMGIWRAWRGELALGWPSPVKGPVNPRFVPLGEASGLGWLGGFDELLCRCGLETNGPPEWDLDQRLKHTLHGRIANLPAHFVAVAIDPATGEISVTGVVHEARLYGAKLRLQSTVTTRLGESRLEITDSVTNLSTQPGDLELLYHINFGPPLAAPGARVYAPVKTLVPRDQHSANDVPTWQTYGPELPGAREVVLYFDLAADADGHTSALLAGADGSQGVSLHFNRRQLPTFTLWKNHQPAADGYATGLEPGINFPNAKSFEKAQGRVATLSPGETRVFEIGMEIHADRAGVERAQQAIADLQRETAPRVLTQPQRGWSPSA